MTFGSNRDQRRWGRLGVIPAKNARIPAYWIVDADAKLIEVWTPEVQFPAVETERETWLPAGAANPLSIELGELFRPL